MNPVAAEAVKRKILVIGNYPLMRQESMLRFAGLMCILYREAGHEVRLLQPSVLFGRYGHNAEKGVGKWLSYLDRFVLFRRSLCRELEWPDVVHIIDHGNAMLVPWLKGKAHLVTCHDLLAIRGAQGDIPGYAVSRTGRLLQRWILSGLRKSQYVVCVSEHTQSELQKVAGLSPDLMSVVYNGLNYPYAPMPAQEAHVRLARLGLDATTPFVLHVGGNQWYKNRIGVVRIFSHLVRELGYNEYHLVLAGKAWTEALVTAVQSSGCADRVHMVTDADNEDLRALYSVARFLLFPSLAEGFGWPIAEAMACGCPVVTSKRAPMTEVGGEAALYIEPDATDAAEQITAMLNPEALAKMRACGQQRAAQLNTDVMKIGYLQAVEETIRRQLSGTSR